VIAAAAMLGEEGLYEMSTDRMVVPRMERGGLIVGVVGGGGGVAVVVNCVLVVVDDEV